MLRLNQLIQWAVLKYKMLKHMQLHQKRQLLRRNTSCTEVDDGRVTREKMTRRRQTIAKRLLEVRQSTAMLTTFNEIDMTNVMALRSRKKDEFFDKNDVASWIYVILHESSCCSTEEISIC